MDYINSLPINHTVAANIIITIQHKIPRGGLFLNIRSVDADEYSLSLSIHIRACSVSTYRLGAGSCDCVGWTAFPLVFTSCVAR